MFPEKYNPPRFDKIAIIKLSYLHLSVHNPNNEGTVRFQNITCGVFIDYYFQLLCTVWIKDSATEAGAVERSPQGNDSPPRLVADLQRHGPRAAAETPAQKLRPLSGSVEYFFVGAIDVVLFLDLKHN